MNRALFMTVGTGLGNNDEKVDSLAHGLLFSINDVNPEHIVFFGSELSRKTIVSLKKQYMEKKNKELECYDFILLDNIDSFDECFDKIKKEIIKFSNYEIKIDYTSGTKTMTMAAALCSAVYRNDLILVTGKRGKDGIVVVGTEEKKTQNLYQVYDQLTLDKVKESFDNNRFKSALELLKEIRIIPNEESYEKLIKSYESWDRFNHELANKFFERDIFLEDFNSIKSQLIENKQVLDRINKNSKFKCDYILADLLNNAERRANEGKYDDAIARLYRSLELIAQIRLKKGYKLITSNIDIEKIKKRLDDKSYTSKLEQRKREGKIKLGLYESFYLLGKLGDDLGIAFNDKSSKIRENLSYRNMSILAHGLENKTYKEYHDFKKIVFEFARLLNTNIENLMNEAKFPKFNLAKGL